MYVLLTFLLVPAQFNGIYIQSLGLNKFTCLAGINRIIPRVFSAAPVLPTPNMLSRCSHQPITPEDHHLMNACLGDLRSTPIVEWMGFHLFMFINFLFLGRLHFFGGYELSCAIPF